MDESAYSTLLTYVEITEYTENLTESKQNIMSQRITFYTMQREKLDEWLEKQESIGSCVLAIPIVPLVNISSMSFKYRVRRCMVLLELLFSLYFRYYTQTNN